MVGVIFGCVLFVIAVMVLNWMLVPSQNMWAYILGFLFFLVVFGELIWNMHKQNATKKVIKKQILLFVLIFIPVTGVLFVMDKVMPDMKHLNVLAVGLLVFFLYVYFTFESEIITVKKTEIKKYKGKEIKQIISSDGRCIEVWNGVGRIFKSSMAEAYFVGGHIEMLPRITNEQFKKIKPGQKYRVKTFRLIGVDRYIWSLEKVRKNRKKSK